MNQLSPVSTVLLVLIVLLIGILVGAAIEKTMSERHTELVKHNCIEYDSKSGKIKWIINAK